MIKSIRIFIAAAAVFVYAGSSFGQISNVSIDSVFQAYRDTLKSQPYPWRLPIMGEKLRKMGFDIPYPNGIMVNYAFSRQQLTINNLSVGFTPDNLVNVDGFARFRSVVADVNAYTARYDFWLLPFLNFSVLGGAFNSTTNVHLGLPIDLQFSTQNNGQILGWGTVFAAGVGPLVLSADFTMAWSFTPALDRPGRSLVAGGRGGYMLRFKKRPDRNLVFLVGAQYLRLNPESSGSADLEKLIGITPEGKLRALEQLDDWYDELSDTEQKILEPVYNGLANYLSDSEAGVIYYTFNKSLFHPVSLSAGFNFQLNHRFQLTSMASFLGSRDQIVVGLSYRFGWQGKNLLSGFTL